MFLMITFWISVLLIGYTYFLYPALLDLYVRWRRRSTVQPEQGPTPSVAVVIAVFNEEKSLKAKIENVLDIEYPADKISFIFGSDGSTDGTNEILSHVNSSNIIVRKFAKRRGKASVLNDLIPTVSSDLVVLSDANTLFSPDAISKLVTPFSDSTVGAVCGALILGSDNKTAGGLGENLYWRYESLVKNLESKVSTTVGATGAFYAIRRALFRPLPTHRAVPDDLVLPMNALRQGLRIAYEQSAVAYEDVTNSVSGEFRRKVRIGARNFYSISEIAPFLHPKYGFASFALWSRKLIRWCVPFLLLLILASSILLAFNSELFAGALIGQLTFYLVAAVGFLLEKRNARIGIFGIPYYFVAMNLALFVGFLKFLSREQPFTWEVVR